LNNDEIKRGSTPGLLHAQRGREVKVEDVEWREKGLVMREFAAKIGANFKEQTFGDGVRRMVVEVREEKRTDEKRNP
jgi:hypothetical protein